MILSPPDENMSNPLLLHGPQRLHKQIILLFTLNAVLEMVLNEGHYHGGILPLERELCELVKQVEAFIARNLVLPGCHNSTNHLMQSIVVRTAAAECTP
jgi:hypothetical protein